MAADTAWSAENMTLMARLLMQQPNLCQRAVANTDDVNESYLIVHQVMTRAFSGVCDHEPDLGPALARALDKRSRRLATLEAAL